MGIDNTLNAINKKFFIYLSKQEKMKEFVMTNKLAKKISRRWIVGETLPEALEASKKLNLEGRMIALDHLGESVTSADVAKKYSHEYHTILAGIFSEVLDSNVSLKLTQMGLDVDEGLCYENVREIVGLAGFYNNFVRIDMEGYPHKQRTINIFKKLKKDYSNVGLVVQSYLYDTEKDVDELLDIGTKFRLCKGAYREPASVAFPKKKDVDENFKKLSEKMLLSGLYHGFATHDEKMIKHVISFAKEKGISKNMFEFQMLFGVRTNLQQELVDKGYNLRVYCGYGDEWYSYTMRRFAESYHNVWFVMRDIF